MEKETFVCSICGKEKDVDAREYHHITPEKTIPVCRSCHKKETAKANAERKLIRSAMIIEISGKKVKASDLRLVPMVAKIIKRHPELKYRAIAEMLGTTVNSVKVLVYKARKRGLLPKRETIP
jgi:ribosome-binding protein aMBF1 (putative translation factor)